MNKKWFDACSVVAYPHEIRFLHIDGGSINYCVDRHVSEYVGKIQAQLNTLQNENRDKDIKNMILQSKIDKINQYLEEHFIFDDKNGEYYQTHTFDKNNAKELHDILKDNKYE